MGRVTLWGKLFKISHHPTKLGANKLCGIGDKMVLVCHVISQNLEPIKVIYYPAKFVDHRHSACRDMFFVCRMTL